MSFLPTREADLLTWSVNFNTLINADPVIYGLTLPQAAAYTEKHDAYAAAYQTAADPSTRTPSSIVAKREAKAALVAEARALAKIIQAFPGTTDTMRSNLGLTVHDVDPSPVPPPTHSPEIDIVSAVMRTVKLRLHNDTSLGTRGKPQGVKGALVFSYVGPLPPAPEDTHLWKFETNTTRTSVEVEFPSTVASGATVWFTAFWYNPRGESGPATPPVSAQIPGSLMQQAA